MELEPQEQNVWNSRANSKNDNIFYSKYPRNKASSDSSVDQLRNGVSMSSPRQHIRSDDQNISFSRSQNDALSNKNHMKVVYYSRSQSHWIITQHNLKGLIKDIKQILYFLKKQSYGSYDETSFLVNSSTSRRPEEQMSFDQCDLDENNMTSGSLNVPDNELSLEIKVDQISSK